MMKLIAASAAIALLAACTGQSDTNVALNEANSSGNAAAVAVENAVEQSAATPLTKDQALALMKQRHHDYETIGKAMRGAKKSLDSGDVASVRSAAATIHAFAPKAASWFPAGTGPDVGKTEAKAEIWQQRAEFESGMKNFAAAAAAFHQAALGSDIAAMKAAHGKLGGTCKACHEKFREEHH
ncbi:MAG: cytochrome c [Sphingomicrobium sp.]